MKKQYITAILGSVMMLLLLCGCNETAIQQEITQDQSPSTLEDTAPADSVQDEDIVVGDTENDSENAADEENAEAEAPVIESETTSIDNDDFDSFNGTGTEFPDDPSIMGGGHGDVTEELPIVDTSDNTVENDGENISESQITPSAPPASGSAPSASPSSGSDSENSSIPSEDKIAESENNESIIPSGTTPIRGNDPTTPPYDLPADWVSEGAYWYWDDSMNMWKVGYTGEDPAIASREKDKQEFLAKYPTRADAILHKAYNRVWVHYYRDYGISFEQCVSEIENGTASAEVMQAFEEAYADWDANYVDTHGFWD